MIHHAAQHIFAIAVPHEKMFALYLLTSFGMAWFFWWMDGRKQARATKAKDFFSYIFNPGMYNHRSSWQDYGIFLVNGLLYYGIIAQFVLSEGYVSRAVHHFLLATFGLPDKPILGGVLALALCTLILALLHDFSVYCAHYLFHKIPTLWAFHKVHHSAEVMTPITVLRLHPVELFFNSLAFAIFIGFGLGVFSYLAMQEMTEVHVFGLNVIIFAFFMMGIHLRHSHVWLHYPAWLSRFLLSPAQHQIHHSTAPRHFDQNFGFMFSFWDRIFGTLYVPKGREELEFGIHKQERNPYASLKAMYLQPFRECYNLFRR